MLTDHAAVVVTDAGSQSLVTIGFTASQVMLITSLCRLLTALVLDKGCLDAMLIKPVRERADVTDTWAASSPDALAYLAAARACLRPAGVVLVVTLVLPFFDHCGRSGLDEGHSFSGLWPVLNGTPLLLSHAL